MTESLRERNTVTDVAHFWHVSRRTVYQLINNGRLSCVRVGGVIRIRRQDVEAYEAGEWHGRDEPLTTGSGVIQRAGSGTSFGPGLRVLSANQQGRKSSPLRKHGATNS